MRSFYSEGSFSLFAVVSFRERFVDVRRFFVFGERNVSARGFEGLFRRVFVVTRFVAYYKVRSVRVTIGRFIRSFVGK